MSERAPDAVPRTLTERAVVILGILALPQDDLSQRNKIQNFIKCNGYDAVLNAAKASAGRMQRLEVANPWADTVSIYNESLVRMEQLYVLIHWVECGLRSHLDIALTHTVGEEWHRDPTTYLFSGLINSFVKDGTQQWQPAENGKRPKAESGILWTDYPTDRKITRTDNVRVLQPHHPTIFLERLTLGNLLHITRYVHKNNQKSFLTTRRGTPISTNNIHALLERTLSIRHDIAHNRAPDKDAYAASYRTLVELLTLLSFDVQKALNNIERARTRSSTLTISS